MLFAGDYKKLHTKALVVDTHNDVLLRVLQGADISKPTADGHTDFERMKEGGLDVQMFSVWCGEDYGKGKAFIRANEMIDSLNALITRNTSKIVFARNSTQLLSGVKRKKIVAMIGVEGGHMIEDSLFYLDSLAKRGMRYLTLTWNNSTNWATSAADETQKKDSLKFIGLTDFGREVVKRLNRLGVMADLSHCGEKTFWDVLAVTKKPVLVSHSCAYSVTPHFRNLKDDQIKAIRKNKGLICINFYSGYVDSTYRGKVKQLRDANKQFIDSVQAAVFSKNRADAIIDSVFAPKYNEFRPPLSAVIEHIEYIVKMIGIDYVGLGGDFDGVESVPQELDDVSKYPNITKELKKRGYSDRAIRKILGENFLRVLKANAG